MPAYVSPRDDDDAIIEVAMRAANAEKFKVLWRGDRAEFNHGCDSRGRPYNTSNPKDTSDSMADVVFAHMLALYTSDPAQIDRLMRRSGLYRAKWDTRRGADTWLSKEAIGRAIRRRADDVATEAATAARMGQMVERAMAQEQASKVAGASLALLQRR